MTAIWVVKCFDTLSVARKRYFPNLVVKEAVILHIALHFMVPAAAVVLFFRKKWPAAYLIMMSAMLIDLDHLTANPIYDPQRCSLGFHPLHGLLPILFYMGLCLYRKTRLIGLGLVIHIALDAIDCQMTNGIWYNS